MADGNYVTLAEAKTLLSRISAIYEVSGTVDDDHLSLIIESAEGMINAAIASRYTIPVTETEAVNYLRGMAIAIMRFKTFSQFADQEDFPELIKTEYKATMGELDKLAKRITSLPNVADKTTGRAAHIKISTQTSSIGGF